MQRKDPADSPMPSAAPKTLENKGEKGAGDDKSSALNHFYHNEFKNFEKELKSATKTARLTAACNLFNIVSDIFTQDEKTNLSAISTRYRIFQKKFHPDKYLDATEKKQAAEIAQLANNAYKLLIASLNKEKEDEEEIKQDAYVDEHEFTLADGFVYDPYHYQRMAKSSAPVRLVKRGEKEKIIEKEGYKAFFDLFMADAITRRFDSGFLRDTVSLDEVGGKEFTVRQQWLAEKALIVPKMIARLHGMDLCKLAICATINNIIPIGRTPKEVFLYYLFNHPESFHARQINDFFNNENSSFIRDLNSKEIADTILKNPKIFEVLPEDTIQALIENLPDIRSFILNDRSRALATGEHILYWELIRHVEKSEEIDDISKAIMTELMYGNMQLFNLLSLQKKQEIAQFINAHNHPDAKPFTPSWLISELKLEADEKLDVSRLDRERYADPEYFLQKFPANPDKMLVFLNEHALKQLLATRDIHWSDCLHAVKQLQEKKSEENSAVLTILKEKICSDADAPLEKNIDIHNADQVLTYWSRPDLSEVTNQSKSAWKTMLMHNLTEEYKLCSTHQQTKEIYTRMSLLDKQAADNITDSIYSEFNRQSDTLIEKIQQGAGGENVQQQLRELLARINIYPWTKNRGDLSEKLRSLRGNDFFRLMEDVLQSSFKEEKASRNFGISIKEDMLISLEKIFRLYACLDCSKEFYKVLGLLTRNFSVPPPKHFDPAFIKTHLLSYARNEFCVYRDGAREQKAYVRDRIVDEMYSPDKTWEFKSIKPLYDAANSGRILENDVKAAYAEICRKTERMSTVAGSISHSLSRRISPAEIRSTSEPIKELEKYMAIKKETGLTDDVLEKRLQSLPAEIKREIGYQAAAIPTSRSAAALPAAARLAAIAVEKKDNPPEQLFPQLSLLPHYAVLNIEGALLSEKGQINERLILQLKRSGIKRISLFTNALPSTIAQDVKREYKISRPGILKRLMQEGFIIENVITPLDSTEKPGEFYRTTLAPLYAKFVDEKFNPRQREQKYHELEKYPTYQNVLKNPRPVPDGEKKEEKKKEKKLTATEKMMETFLQDKQKDITSILFFDNTQNNCLEAENINQTINQGTMPLTAVEINMNNQKADYIPQFEDHFKLSFQTQFNNLLQIPGTASTKFSTILVELNTISLPVEQLVKLTQLIALTCDVLKNPTADSSEKLYQAALQVECFFPAKEQFIKKWTDVMQPLLNTVPPRVKAITLAKKEEKQEKSDAIRRNMLHIIEQALTAQEAILTQYKSSAVTHFKNNSLHAELKKCFSEKETPVMCLKKIETILQKGIPGVELCAKQEVLADTQMMVQKINEIGKENEAKKIFAAIYLGIVGQDSLGDSLLTSRLAFIETILNHGRTSVVARPS